MQATELFTAADVDKPAENKQEMLDNSFAKCLGRQARRRSFTYLAPLTDQG